MKNMKIEVNSEQPLDEIVKELERLGYEESRASKSLSSKFIYASDCGYFYALIMDMTFSEPTTLSELKEM